MLVFISPASAQSTWILNEFRMAQGEGVRILPILLHATPIKELPPWLARIQWLDMSRYPPAAAAREVAAEVVKFLTHFKSTTAPTQLPDRQRQTLAEALAAQARDQTEQPKEKDKQPPNTIFIVHGHDEEFLRDVEDFLRQSGIKPIIMKDVGGVSASLIEKFFEVGKAADFAIVLLSGDDMGASRLQYETTNVGERALQYRSRQNVTLELGFFYGKLGWESVFVLEREPPKVFPNFERPSDLNGVLWDRYDKQGKWRTELHSRLVKRGFQIPAQSVKSATQ
jgi:predicted nucleotide-binding protein